MLSDRRQCVLSDARQVGKILIYWFGPDAAWSCVPSTVSSGLVCGYFGGWHLGRTVEPGGEERTGGNRTPVEPSYQRWVVRCTGRVELQGMCTVHESSHSLCSVRRTAEAILSTVPHDGCFPGTPVSAPSRLVTVGASGRPGRHRHRSLAQPKLRLGMYGICFILTLPVWLIAAGPNRKDDSTLMVMVTRLYRFWDKG